MKASDAHPQPASVPEQSERVLSPRSPDVDALLALQRSAGNHAVARFLARRDIDADPPKDVDREEAERLGAQYETSRAELEAWVKAPHSRDNVYIGQGIFSVDFNPRTAKLQINVPCVFTFKASPPYKAVLLKSGKKAKLPADGLFIPKPGEEFDNLVDEPPMGWTEEEKAPWKAKFFAAVHQAWASPEARFQFHCQRDWWEHLRAETEVRFYEATDDKAANTTKITVTKQPAAGGYTPERSEAGRGVMKLNEGDVDPVKGQVVAAHEAGHVLGLGDEYKDAMHGHDEGPVSHAPLVKKYLGETVEKDQDPESLMAGGGAVRPRHGVAFLEALNQLSEGACEWGYQPKRARAIPGRRGDGHTGSERMTREQRAEPPGPVLAPKLARAPLATAGPDHYVFEVKAWIPMATVPDPEDPLRDLAYRAQHLSEEVSDYRSEYRGDGHDDYPGAYRVLHRVEFDWDGTAMTNVIFPPLAHFGASHRVWSAMIKPFGGIGRPRLDRGEETATTSRSVSSVHAPGTNEIRLGMASPNPLTLAPAPDIDADYTLFVSRDFGEDTITVRWTTDFMPNHGFRVEKNGTDVGTRIVNKVPASLQSHEIFIRLNAKSNGGADSLTTLPG